MGDGDRDRWNDKWAEAGRGTDHRSELVELMRPWLPATGTLLDVAGLVLYFLLANLILFGSVTT